MPTTVATGQLTLVDVNDGLSASLTNSSTVLNADASGAVSSFVGAETSFKIIEAGADTTNLWTYFVSATGGGISYRDFNDTADRTGTGATSGLLDSALLKVTALTQDLSYVDITARKAGMNDITRRYSVAKAKAGVRGTVNAAAPITGTVWSDLDANAVVANVAGGAPITGDIVTLHNSAQAFSETRVRSSGGTWTIQTAFFGGNVIVDGTLAGNKLQANTVSANKLQIGALTFDRLRVVGHGSNQAAGQQTDGIYLDGTVIGSLTAGTPSSTASRGLFVAEFNRTTHALISHKRYDVYSQTDARAQLVVDLDAMPATSVVCVRSRDAILMTADIAASLQRCGAGDGVGVGINHRYPYALIGIPGIGIGNGIESLQPNTTDGPNADVAAFWVDSDVQGIGSSFGPLVALGATRIQNGAIQTDKLAANAVTTAKLAANSVTAGELAANAVTAGKVAAGAISTAELAAAAITTDKLAAGAIVASKLSIGDTSNIYPDAEMAECATYATDGAATRQTVASDGGPSLYQLSIAGHVDLKTAYSPNFAVEGGKSYAVSAWMETTGSGGGTSQLWFETFSDVAGTVSLSVRQVGATVSSTTPSRQLAVLAVEAGAKRARLSFVKTAGATTRTAVFSAPIVRRAGDSELIVDGAITAIKVATGSITASKIHIGDTSNMTPDPTMSDTASWTGSEFALVTFPSPSASENYLQISSSSSGDQQVRSLPIAIEAAKQYFASIVAWGGNSNVQAVASIEWYSDSAGTTLISANAVASVTGGVSSLRSFGIFVAPAGARTCRWLFDRNIIASSTSSAAFHEPILRRATSGELIVDGAITANKIIAGAITTEKVAANAITATQIAAGTVTANELAAGAITTPKISANAITTALLAASAVTANELAANSVVAGKVAAGAISTTELAAGAITTDKLGAGAVTTEKLAVGDFTNYLENPNLSADFSVGWTGFGSLAGFERIPSSADNIDQYLRRTNGSTARALGGLVNNYLLPVKAGDVLRLTGMIYHVGAIGATLGIVSWNASKTASNISSIAMTSSASWYELEYLYTVPAGVFFVQLRIADNGVADTTLRIANLGLRRMMAGSLIVDGAVTTNKLTASSVTTAKLAANAVTVNELAANAVTADKIAANAITVGKIAAAAISSTEIAAGAITASKLAIGDTTNLFPDPDLVECASYATDGTLARLAVATNAGPSLYQLRVALATDEKNAYSPSFPVEGGKSYGVSAWLARTGSGTGTAQLWFETFSDIAGTLSLSVRQVGATSSSTTPTRQFSLLAVEAEAKRARLVFKKTAGTNYHALFSAPVVRRAGDAELVVDGSITGIKVAAGSITATKLLIGDTSNMVPDPLLNDLSAWTFAGTRTTSTNTGLMAGKSWRLTVDALDEAGTYLENNATSSPIPVEKGKTYFFSTILSRSASGSVSFEVNWYSDTAASTLLSSAVIASRATGTSGSLYAHNGVAAAPATAITARIVYRATVPTNVGGQYGGYSDPVMRRAADGQLIVDGAITADKLSANSVTAGKIAAAVISATEIAAGAITASKLAISDTSNIFPDPDMVEVVSYATSPTFTIVRQDVVAAGGSSQYQLAIASTSAERNAYSPMFSVEGGKSYAISAFLWRSSTGSSAPQLWFETFSDIAGITMLSSRLVGAAGSALTPTRQMSVYAAEADAKRARLVFRRTAGTGAAAYFSGPNVRRAGDSELIVDGAITALKVAADAISGGKIQANAITSDKIAANSITADLIATNAITAGTIAAAAVSTAQLTTSAVTAEKIAASAVSTTQLAANSITSEKIVSGAITASQIAAGAVTAGKIAAGAVTANELAADSVTAGKIAAAAVSTTQLAAGAITTDKIAAGAITASKLAIGSSTNQIYNSEFFAGTSGIFINTGSGGVYSLGVDLNSEWILKGSHTLYLRQNGSDTGASAYMHFPARPPGNNATTLEDIRFPVEGGKTYEFSAYLGTHRCSATIYLEFCDASGTAILTSAGQTSVDASGGVLLQQYQRIGVIGTAPANASQCRPFIGKSGTLTGGDSYLFVARPFFGQTVAGATELQPWSPSGITMIQGGQIVTNTIVTEHLTANSITTAKLAANAVTANELAANSVTAGKVAAGAISTAELAAGAITASKLAISDLENLCSNGMGASGEGWSAHNMTADSFGWTLWGNVPSTTALTFHTRDNFYGPVFPIRDGEQFWTSFDAVVGGGGAAVYSFAVGLALYDKDYNVSGFLTGGAANLPVSGYTSQGGSLTIPSGSHAFARVWVQVGGFDDFFANGKHWHATRIQVRRRNAGELIVDGAITASKIAAGSITGDKIEATAIDGKTITGAVLRTGTTGRRIEIKAADELCYYDTNNALVASIGYKPTSPSAGKAGMPDNTIAYFRSMREEYTVGVHSEASNGTAIYGATANGIGIYAFSNQGDALYARTYAKSAIIVECDNASGGHILYNNIPTVHPSWDAPVGTTIMAKPSGFAGPTLFIKQSAGTGTSRWKYVNLT